MAWKTLKFKLTGLAPLIMHNGQTASPVNKFSKAIKLISSKRSKTDADFEEMARLEFLAGLYMDANGPVLPSMMIDAMLVNAAKKSKDGVKAKSGVFCLEHARLEYEGPRTADELWQDEQFRFSAIVRVQQARVERMRPVFNEWSAVISLSVEDSIVNPKSIEDWLIIGGTQIGLGDWRPQHGRFTVEKL